MPSTPTAAKVEEGSFGNMLVARGLLSADDLNRAQTLATQRRQQLTQVVIDEKFVREADTFRALAEYLHLDYINVLTDPVDAAAARLISEAQSRRYVAIPVGWVDAQLVVAMADPTNIVALDDIRTVTGVGVRAAVASRSAILDAVGRYHRRDTEANNISAEASDAFAADNVLVKVREVVEDAPIVKLVNVLISQAIADRASDIHIEPAEHDLRVRYRIDGVLHEVMRPSKNIQNGIVSRLKVMADINIAERRIPQDGRITTAIDGHNVDLRVATLPTVFGEKVVMRILDQSTAMLKLPDLGFFGENMARYERSYRKPYGTILVTGPTGSGKSTTLYATLNILNVESKNVITVEDPVEYQLPGINQVQVNHKAGLSFAAALRSILRSDPDIILVGEIRDRETAIIAIEAALTGHLVLSTLHTNDAATTPGRLIEMGVEPFLVGSSLDCIVAQRLARRLCINCRQPYLPARKDLESVGWDMEYMGDNIPTLYRAVGCGACGQTGYKGRFAIHEVMQVDERIERMICDRSHSDEIRDASVEQGMLTLRQVGLREVAYGKTSLEEVLRVIA
jgi:type IV pilus assembly protein PilB